MRVWFVLLVVIMWYGEGNDRSSPYNIRQNDHVSGEPPGHVVIAQAHSHRDTDFAKLQNHFQWMKGFHRICTVSRRVKVCTAF